MIPLKLLRHAAIALPKILWHSIYALNIALLIILWSCNILKEHVYLNGPNFETAGT